MFTKHTHCVCISSLCVLVAQSYLTLCNPIDCNPPGPSVHGILQVRTQVACHLFSKRNYRKKESEVTQSCPTLCDPMDCSLPGSPIHGIFQARVLEWVPFPSTAQSCPILVTPWTVACQAPLSMEFSRQESWSGLPFPSPGDLPNPRIKLPSLYCRQILYHLSHQGSP